MIDSNVTSSDTWMDQQVDPSMAISSRIQLASGRLIQRDLLLRWLQIKI